MSIFNNEDGVVQIDIILVVFSVLFILASLVVLMTIDDVIGAKRPLGVVCGVNVIPDKDTADLIIQLYSGRSGKLRISD